MKTALSDALPSFECPLLFDVMSDPVIVRRTGQTYERASIERWLARNDTCPSTGVQLNGDHELVPNYALKRCIDEWKACKAQKPNHGSSTTPLKSLLENKLTQDLTTSFAIDEEVCNALQALDLLDPAGLDYITQLEAKEIAEMLNVKIGKVIPAKFRDRVKIFIKSIQSTEGIFFLSNNPCYTSLR